MAAIRAITSFLLLALVVPAGIGHVEVCLCEASAGDHGMLCGVDLPSEPKPGGCCASEAVEEAQAPDSDSCPGCPSVELPQDDLLLTTPTETDDSPAPLALLGVADAAALATLEGQRAWPATLWPRPPPGRHRIHLLHRVFLL